MYEHARTEGPANSSVLIEKMISLRDKTLSIKLVYTLEGFSILSVTEIIYVFMIFRILLTSHQLGDILWRFDSA